MPSNKSAYSPKKVLAVLIVALIAASIIKGYYKHQQGEFKPNNYETASAADIINTMQMALPYKTGDYLTAEKIQDITPNSLTVVYISKIPEGFGNVSESLKVLMVCESTEMKALRSKGIKILAQAVYDATGKVVETLSCP